LQLLISICLFLSLCPGCTLKDYSLLHHPQPLPGVCREGEVFDRGQLRVHWVAYYPDKGTRLPAVLVHPDAAGFAQDMEGICFALAQHGYVAAAVHYQRLDNPKEKNAFACCKTFEEGTTAYEYLLTHPRVDRQRVGLLGFSKGGLHSLLISATDPGVKAVVAYYPLTDFEEWLNPDRYAFPARLRIRHLRREVMKRQGASCWEEVLPAVRDASPINHVQTIHSPVLLVHGEKDRTVPLSQAQRFLDALKAAGGDCELLVFPGAGHVFNFRDKEQGTLAWERTVEFLDRHLKAGNHLSGAEK
jgi:dienelactone hydrolase